MPCIFFQKWLKLIGFQKSENIPLSIFFRSSKLYFLICLIIIFLITFEKYARYSFFNALDLWILVNFHKKFSPKINMLPNNFSFTKLVV